MGAGDYAIRFTKEEYNETFSNIQSNEEIKDDSSQCENLLPLDTSKNIYSKSIFTFDAAINSHPRFLTLTRNICERCGKKVSIQVPLYIDKYSKVPIIPTETKPYPSYIYMDSMQFRWDVVVFS
jgi:hypothetical protein